MTESHVRHKTTQRVWGAEEDRAAHAERIPERAEQWSVDKEV